jgi:hypothetical protein
MNDAFQQLLGSVAYGGIAHNDARIRCARAVYERLMVDRPIEPEDIEAVQAALLSIGCRNEQQAGELAVAAIDTLIKRGNTGATREAELWQELRDLFGLDGYHDGHFNGIPNPEQIITHIRHVSRERARLLKLSIDNSGWKLAMRVMQSDLYAQLDEAEKAECDALVLTNPHLAKPERKTNKGKKVQPNGSLK